jgi:hypothetical protein
MCSTDHNLILRILKGQAWWLMPVILVILEAEIRRIRRQSQAKKVHETLSQFINAGPGSMHLSIITVLWEA